MVIPINNRPFYHGWYEPPPNWSLLWLGCIPGSKEGFWVRESLQPQSAHLRIPQGLHTQRFTRNVCHQTRFWGRPTLSYFHPLGKQTTYHSTIIKIQVKKQNIYSFPSIKKNQDEASTSSTKKTHTMTLGNHRKKPNAGTTTDPGLFPSAGYSTTQFGL